MHPGRRHQESPATLDERVLALEERVTAVAEAVRVLAHGLEDMPAAEPAGRRAAAAARQAYDLLLVAGQRAGEPDRPPASDGPRGQLPSPGAAMDSAPLRLRRRDDGPRSGRGACARVPGTAGTLRRAAHGGALPDELAEPATRGVVRLGVCALPNNYVLDSFLRSA